ncbi:hypothetical protein [Comamonas sp. JC664]|uniref:hypothetical protein n=1 Tax=Comamonas sp. JC664 TaxID=2801917 RepID=UPI003608B5B2
MAGDNQTAHVGQAFAQRLQAKVVDAQGAAMAGHVVVFTLPSAAVGSATASFADAPKPLASLPMPKAWRSRQC